jgi:hypothetical protein
VAETQGGTERPDNERAPTAPELLRAAMEKVVFFEWRLGEMAAELAAAQARAAAAEAERDLAAAQRSESERQAFEARQQAHHLESERDRLGTLLARPAQAVAEAAAVHTERTRADKLESELAEAQREIERQRLERDRWLAERLAEAKGEGSSEGSLAEFIAELRGEVIALRERQKQCDDLLQSVGIEPPPSASRPPPAGALPPLPRDPMEQARTLWTQGRLGSMPAPTPGNPSSVARPPTSLAANRPAPAAATRDRAVAAARARRALPSAAAVALAEQCMRGLSARDPARREQAARHLAAVPVTAAAPALASAIRIESEPRARGQMAAALVACGGAAAADLVAEMLADPAPLVRLAALDALCSIPDRAVAALETAAGDPSAAVRRRAAALSTTLAAAEVRARLAMDPDESVRAATTSREAAAAPNPVAPSRDAEPAKLRMTSPAPVPMRPALAESESGGRDLAREAVLAIQTAIFGLTDSELAAALSVPEAVAGPLVARLVSSGRLTRRGKRLVATQISGVAAQGGP